MGMLITGVLKAFTQLAKPAEHLYRELQFGLRAAVGTRTLDELLENKAVIDDVVTAHVRSTRKYRRVRLGERATITVRARSPPGR